MKDTHYKNIKIRSLPGIHGEVFNLITKFLPERKIRILDFGCGPGALSQRLKDAGYTHILSVDWDSDQFMASTKFRRIDFNDEEQMRNFSMMHKNKFDIAISVEVIEHLKNPWLYVETMKNVIKKGRYILITTPNISSWFSRLNFLLEGRPRRFAKENFRRDGHITPVSLWQIRNMFNEFGLTTVRVRTYEGNSLFYFPSIKYKWIAAN
ncbi:class I SAM-dependent methyltransferase, partial [Candidatus Woesearchaeota archaeon]